ncbi:hypothetical protein VNO77_22611 [Canavalia gladiata]|uniref:3'-5' exonuclease domain-containing protein n=1 Tax=Canavalia gladiata TaxID=3824 RepID=A0AAN9QAY4_CANGL
MLFIQTNHQINHQPDSSLDGQRIIHPLEKLFVLDLENLVLIKPPPIECTPFKLVEEVRGLKESAAKLSSVNEFAVDLEHNQYRSFEGLTCLMQISTRTEDFVIDTLKVQNHVRLYPREIFKDPTQKKVMHGADRDIIWLQRDFGIYRLRPLPDVMLRYGREDTLYLLYIYGLMRIKLVALSKECQGSDDPLVELAVVSRLFEWHDILSHGDDESPGYVSPNKLVLEIAKQMPVGFHLPMTCFGLKFLSSIYGMVYGSNEDSTASKWAILLGERPLEPCPIGLFIQKQAQRPSLGQSCHGKAISFSMLNSIYVINGPTMQTMQIGP